MSLLDYLFEFLDSYNFSSGKEAKGGDVISPAVLGLIFEKINGYKDGSYYTPDNITSFMARKSLETILISRVNAELGYNFENYDYLRSSFKESMPEEKKEKVKQIIKELRILDPAVGLQCQPQKWYLQRMLEYWIDNNTGKQTSKVTCSQYNANDFWQRTALFYSWLWNKAKENFKENIQSLQTSLTKKE